MRLPTVTDIERRIPRPEDFRSRARGPQLTARLGTAIGVCFAICFLTGLWSHVQYSTPGWLTLSPHPTQLYRWTQGLHVISGTAVIPLLLAKLWSVFPRLFARPPRGARALAVTALERASIAVLMGSSLFMLASGTLNIIGWYPWEFSFRRTHGAMAWVAIGSVLVHVAVKLPVIREALGQPTEDAPPAADAAAPTRRAVLQAAFVASGLAVLLTAGQSVPWLRRVSAFSVRPGDGPQDLPINRTAREAGTGTSALDPAWALEVTAGGRTVRLTRDDLLAMPQRTHRLPIACVEGWSRSAEWTGVPVRDVIALVGAGPDTDVVLRSLQTKGAFGSSRVVGNVVRDPRTLLALELNGETLDVDHGYPCRLIAPNRPGVFQTKWVDRLQVQS
ncbi:molybdopterin-dependent oxidoreductase [Aeromicrobium chenweiae]|uniref:Molybdopterin-binding protein n=1 Tax=Aeromicrobium chenweiae TaxID=2079793 RepID=A0A2S0WR59_9ACTN|nr:molybdopterin-dependent oxidoreductase [Aeromicrobium chenweiae]AWB93797.1 molybdopterin-binding protein [Aeromicrobium chenweiae]TGN30842.1 molybdopterin-binding protein [Aeromicrobium chenweiae]